MLQIARFANTDAEFAAVAQINRALYADDTSTAAEIRHYDSSRNPDYLFQRYTLRWNGDIAGYGMIFVPYWSYAPGKYTIYVAVRPEYQRRGIGAAFYEEARTVLAACDPSPTLLQSRTRTDTPQGIRFLEARGFHQVMRWWESKLDLAGFTFADYAPLLERLAAQGIAMTTAQELADRDDDWQYKIYLVDREATLDEPQPGTPTPIGFDEYRKLVFGNPLFRPERLFLAVDGDTVVAMVELPANPNDPQHLECGFTGVLRSHRRRGIATALKAVALDYARRSGAETIATGNEEHNPMYQINLNMGFRPTMASLAFEKHVIVGTL